MLAGAGGVAVPGVVGEVEEPGRAVGRLRRVARKYDLVTDERAQGRCVGHVQRPPPGPGREAARQCDELPDAEAFEKAAEGQVLAERNKVDLVVGRKDLAVVADDIDAVEDSLPRR